MNFNKKIESLKLECEKQQQQQTHGSIKDIKTTTAEKELHLLMMQKIQTYIENLEKSQFFTTFLGQIRNPEASHHLHKITQSHQKIKMVVYGIGSIESDKPPRWQLSLAILMKRNLDWIGDMEVYDPIISWTESKVMEELGFSVLSVNEVGKRQAVDPILFFMPCCHFKLYKNLLKANWRHDMLNRIVVLGNSFELIRKVSFEEKRKNNILMNIKHIAAIQPLTKEFKVCIVSDGFDRAFNYLSWHFFSVDPDTNLELTF